MKAIKIILILFVTATSLTISFGVSAQPCLPNGIDFSSQSMIDDFQINHPGCSIIEGDVMISGIDITNLNGLNEITEIQGSLSILANFNLNNISGLTNLSIIGGYFKFRSNNILINMQGLNNLSSVSGYVEIEDNDNLSTLQGLENLTYIGGDFIVFFNDHLLNLEGINNLSFIGERLLISYNNALVSLSGLENVSSKIELVAIGFNPILVDISSIGNIGSITDGINIRDNFILPSLDGLENINLDSLQFLYILNNSMLSYCALQNICNYIENSNNYDSISDNSLGCNSHDEVANACLTGNIDMINNPKQIIIYPNPAENYIKIELKDISITQLRFELINEQGSLIATTVLNPIISTINIENFTPGVYYGKVLGDGVYIVKKIIKLK